MGVLTDVFNGFVRLCLYGQKFSLNEGDSLTDRLLAARDMAFAAMIVVSQTSFPCQEKGFLPPVAIIYSHILPRIERVLDSLEQDQRMRQQGSRSGADYLVSERKYEMRVAHIELMVYLIKNRESFSSKFWASIVSWQIEAHRRFCEQLLADYRDATSDMREDEDGVKAFVAALERAVKRAHALQGPDPEKAQFYDAFSIRSIYDDPDVKALISSDRFTSEKRRKLQEAVDDLLLEQPMFPPECYALKQMFRISIRQG